MPGKLRVLVVTNTYPTADRPGDSPQICDHVEALRARGVEADVFYINRYKGGRAYAAAAWELLHLTFRPARYDLVHAFYGHAGLLARLQVKYPVVVTFLGSDLLNRRDARIGKPAARLADAVIVQSEEMKRAARRDDAHVIPFGVNRQLFAGRSATSVRRELDLPPDDRIVLFPWDPARRVKRYDLIETAVQLLQARGERVRIVVVFDQPHDVIARYMSACDALVLASDHEGSPMALREALACGLPIVAVDVGDVRQLIENVAGCYLCEREPGDIAAKLALALAHGRAASVPAPDAAPLVNGALGDAAWAADQVLLIYERLLSRRTAQQELREGAA